MPSGNPDGIFILENVTIVFIYKEISNRSISQTELKGVCFGYQMNRNADREEIKI